MNNDDDLLETNRFITGVDVNLDGENPYLNTEASYKNFLKTNFKVDIDNDIKDNLLRHETYDELLDEEDLKNDEKTIEKNEKHMFLHDTNIYYSIDSRYRDDIENPNVYDFNIFLEREFRDLVNLSIKDVEIPWVSDCDNMVDASGDPYQYLYFCFEMEGLADTLLNTVMVPIEKVENRKNMLVFGKVGLSHRTDGMYIYNKIIHGNKNLRDFNHIIKSSSHLNIKLLNPYGNVIDSQDSELLDPTNSNYLEKLNWNITLEFKEQVYLLKKTNLNTKYNTIIDDRSKKL